MTNWNAPLQVHGLAQSDIQGKFVGSVTTMPTASADYLGVALLYTGATTSTYSKGSTYVCEQDGTSYKWTETSGGGGGTRFYLTVTVTVGGSAGGAGILVAIAGEGSGYTDSSGKCILTVSQMKTYTISAGDDYEYPLTTDTVAITDVMNAKTIAIAKKNAKVTISGAEGCTWSPTPVSQGDNFYLDDAVASYTITPPAKAGHFTPDPVTLTSPYGDRTVTFAYHAYPKVAVSVTDAKSYTGDVTVTAVDGGGAGTTVTKNMTVGSSAEFVLDAEGSWFFSIVYGMPTGGSCSGATQAVVKDGTYSVTLEITYGAWSGELGLVFDSSKISTDPTGCLTYGGDMAGAVPLKNESTTLATATNYAASSWYMKPDGTSDNKLLNGCFYATFDSTGLPHEKLNPNDLSKVIATWDGTKWVAASGSSSITTENTMFCIPTVYTKGTDTGYDISSDSTKGTPWAHTVDGKTYKYLGIGVYLGYNNSSKLMSLSGKTATVSVSLDDFRTYAHNNPSSIGAFMLWNYWQWTLLRMMVITSIKSFQSQGLIGQGGAGTATTGTMNAMGAFAGNVSGTSDHEKAFIEDFWGVKYQFVDDVKYLSSKIYAGQHTSGVATSSDTEILSGMTSPGGFAKYIGTADVSWGIGDKQSGTGDKTVGTCDGCGFPFSSSPCVYVGGYSYHASGGSAGVSYFSSDLGSARTLSGARLAYLFDI